MYPTLSSIAEGLLSAFIRSADDVQELNARETAILQALDSLYDRRFRELKTQNEFRKKEMAGTPASDNPTKQ